ncbi:MAG: undecaprenyldiphospho-muramoylpentapeptide beta-N-acetylglucosaminyltransferase [Tissierellia bacterium]|nr:undecaprenyldiphospho-muramoylpentapeptide beta-N-acetylglucosaminyltransferase [Tissierellia bacterium]
MRLIISGGGTGGHIYPALAIADEFMKQNPSGEVLYVGKEGGLEQELVKEAGYDFAPIHIQGLPRKVLNKKTIMSFYALLKGLRECEKIIKDFKPDIVVGTGGYVCAPILLKAQQKGIPTLIQEQNAYPGKTNRFLAKKAKAVALSFEEAKKFLPDSDNIILTGNPVREEIFNSEENKAHDEEPYHVLSFGGSGGQESTNQAILDIIKYQTFDFQLTHITGKVHYDKFMEELKDIPWPDQLTILPYSHEIPYLLSRTDLVIASSSAMTLAEISGKGLPSILIPKSYTAGNHQVYNARSYEDKKAAIVIYEEDLNGQILLEKVNDLLNDFERREKMGMASQELANPKAVELIVTAMMNMASHGGKNSETT